MLIRKARAEDAPAIAKVHVDSWRTTYPGIVPGEFLASLRQGGITSLLAWVLAANPARLFYEAMGGLYLREKEIEIGGQRLVEAAYGWKDTRNLHYNRGERLLFPGQDDLRPPQQRGE